VNALALAASIAVGLLSIVWLTQADPPVERPGRDATGRSRSARRSVSASTQLLRKVSRSDSRRRPAGRRSRWSRDRLPSTTPPRASGSAPLTASELPTWGFLAILGIIGGGPTFLGGVVGYSFTSDLLSIVFLSRRRRPDLRLQRDDGRLPEVLRSRWRRGVALLAGLVRGVRDGLRPVAVGA
jgi:hypothetical protein